MTEMAEDLHDIEVLPIATLHLLRLVLQTCDVFCTGFPHTSVGIDVSRWMFVYVAGLSWTRAVSFVGFQLKM
jgi:hypothetical protein